MEGRQARGDQQDDEQDDDDSDDNLDYDEQDDEDDDPTYDPGGDRVLPGAGTDESTCNRNAKEGKRRGKCVLDVDASQSSGVEEMGKGKMTYDKVATLLMRAWNSEDAVEASCDVGAAVASGLAGLENVAQLCAVEESERWLSSFKCMLSELQFTLSCYKYVPLFFICLHC